ncbi:zf-TFIIB domain-containing protein [Chloroflexota bacterium]
MDCPVCKGAMIIVEHAGIEVDYSPDCKGVWFDSGELELLLESMELDESGLTANEIMSFDEAKVDEKKRRCPICNKKMKKVILGTNPEVLIDACPNEHGLWFDGGEVGQVIRQLIDGQPESTDKQGKVLSFLGEVFKVGD